MTSSNPYAFPQDYNTYYIGKMMRTRPIRHAMELNGYVWYVPQTGRLLFWTEAKKMLEELTETAEAHSAWQRMPDTENRAHLLEELADVNSIINRMLKRHKKPEFTAAQSTYTGTLGEALVKWKYVNNDMLKLKAKNKMWPTSFIKMSLAFALNSIQGFMEENGIRQHELLAAYAAKEASSGPLLPGRVDFIALPKAASEKWVTYFTQKFPMVEGDMLNLSRANKKLPSLTAA